MAAQRVHVYLVDACECKPIALAHSRLLFQHLISGLGLIVKAQRVGAVPASGKQRLIAIITTGIRIGKLNVYVGLRKPGFVELPVRVQVNFSRLASELTHE